MKTDRQKALDAALSQIEKDFGKETLMRLGDKMVGLTVDAVSTGVLPLDIILGVGGLPRGRVVECLGLEAGGKSTLSMVMMAHIQKLGGIAALVDSEHAFDTDYAKKVGVDTDNLYICQPDSGEQGLEVVERLVRSGAVDIIVVDSVAALVPKAELEGEMGQSVMGAQARLMSQALRKLTAIISKSKTIVVFINQIRQKIGIMFGNPETTPGGLALKFYSSIRLDIRAKEKIKVGDIVVGNVVKVKTIKNKVAPPFQQCEFEIIFGQGIPREGCIADVALEHGILEKVGSWISYKDEKIGQGRNQVIEYFKSNPKFMEAVEQEVRDKLLPSKTEKVEEVVEKKVKKSKDEK